MQHAGFATRSILLKPISPTPTIQTLYMSNNSVSNLEGLSQFSQLENLSLANNCVSDVRQLDVLAKACPSLESLMLEGNPVASGPNYRAQVVLRLPTCVCSALPPLVFPDCQYPHPVLGFLWRRLKTLDGLEVTDQERDRALTTVRQEQGMLDIMITNDCLLQKLVSGGAAIQTSPGLCFSGSARGDKHPRPDHTPSRPARRSTCQDCSICTWI